MRLQNILKAHFSLRKAIKQKKQATKVTCLFGDPGGTRTHDPQLRRLLLYPAELLDHPFFCVAKIHINR